MNPKDEIKCNICGCWYNKDVQYGPCPHNEIQEKCSICGAIPIGFSLTNIKCPNGVEWRCPDCIGKGKTSGKK